jgi:hypothetical protein
VAGGALLGVLVAAAIAVCAWPQQWLAVRDDAGLRYAFAVDDGTRFSLAWQHSVEREDWIETFAIRGKAIVLAATRFKTFGAGVPDHAGRRTTLEHGWVVMDGIDRVVDPLAVQAAAAEDYRMRVGERWFALSSEGAAPILRFAVIRAPLIAVIGGVVRAWRAPAAGLP